MIELSYSYNVQYYTTYELNFLIYTMGLKVFYFENLKCIYPVTVSNGLE